MPITPTIPIPGIVIDKLTYPVKKLLGFTAKNSMQAQGKSEKEIIQDLIKRDNPSFYSEQTRDGGNEIDTYLYGTPYNTENTSNVGPSYENYLSANFPLRKHAVKAYDAHFGDTLYIDQKYKDQVLDELEQGKTVGASMGRYAHAPSYIVNTKDDERRPYDAGGHLMQFQYDQNGDVVANMSDIYDFLPKDFEDKYGAIKEYGPIKTAGMYAMHYAGTPFIVRQNGIPVRFKEIVPEYKTELQSQLGNFLSNWGDMYDLTIPHRLTDEQIEEIFDGKQSGDEILDFMDQKGYLAPVFKKGGSIHIKKKNRGKFTKSAKRAGMGVQEYARHILANKDKYSSTLVKRANFARNAKKFKHENGGILKYQNPAMVLPEIVELQSKKIWNSKPVKKARKLFTAVNDRLNGDREWISGEPTKYGNYGEYPANKGIGAIGLLAGPSSTSASAFKVTDLNGIKKVNIKLGNVDDYWYVGHQTGSANFPKIYKDGLNTNNGLNGTALHLTEGYMDDFANGRLMQKHMSHEGADGLVVMKFPKSKFPSGKLDDISERLMDLGESKSFEVPSKYLQFFKRSQW